MVLDWLRRCSCLRSMCESVARGVNSSKTNAAVDDWLVTMSAHETRMVGRCRGGTCRPERTAWMWCVVWLATNVCLTRTEWQSVRWHCNMHCSKNYMLPCCTLYQTFHNIHYYHNEKREIACNAFYNTNTQLEYIQWLQYGYYRPGVKLKTAVITVQNRN